MKPRNGFLIGPAIILICTFAQAFETPTHYAISLHSADIAVSDAVRLNLGLGSSSYGDTFISSTEGDVRADFNKVEPQCGHSRLYLLTRLIACGAMFEDFYWYTRPLNHFSDPQHLDSDGNGKPLPFSASAAEWGLQDHPNLWPVESYEDPQKYSYSDAEDYLWNALTYRLGVDAVFDSQNRAKNLGMMFQSLGQVIHLVQDMASPQHTRNEPHFDKLNLGTFSEKSRYEQRALIKEVDSWIQRCLVIAGSTDCTYNTGTAIAPVYPAHADRFQSARAFFESSYQTGLAQVTSNSFPSNLRNFLQDRPGHYIAAAHYPLPAPGTSKDVSLGELMEGIPEGMSPFILNACNGDLANCKMRMIGAAIADPLASTPATNDRASSESLFDMDLTDLNRSAVVFDPLTGTIFETRTYATLNINRFNIDRAYSLLIPRAVAYSAGLLNFFFRGAMAIKPSASGVYAIADGSAFSPANPTIVANGFRGFKTVHARVANTTESPDSAPLQSMTNGKLWAVVRFRRNKCYTDDFDGEATIAAPLSDCLDANEEIVVSDPIDRTGLGTTVIPRKSDQLPDGDEFEFTFQNEIPINAWNLLLQIVFRGTLGAEENKIAVSTVDISEPTFFNVFNNTDYAMLGGSCYTAEQLKADPNLWGRVRMDCKITEHPGDILAQGCNMIPLNIRFQSRGTAQPQFSIATDKSADGDGRLPAKRFSRIAVLAGVDDGFDLQLKFDNSPLQMEGSAPVLHIDPYHAHRSRTVPGDWERDIYVTERGIKTWEGFSVIFDMETGNVAAGGEDTCMSGSKSSLSVLTDAARYPVPSRITFYKN